MIIKSESLFKFLLILLFFFSFLLLSYVSLVVFHNYPYCQDEHAYLLQAETFAKGHLNIKIPANENFLKDFHMIYKEGKLYAEYPPGFSMFLSIGVFLGIPGLINPFLAIIALFFIFKTIRTFVELPTAFWITLLISTNSYFIAYSASYFSQPLALTITCIGFYLYRKYELLPNSKVATILGVVIGLEILVRQVDAFCLFLIVGLGIFFLALKNKRWLDLYYLIGGSIIGVLCLGCYVFLQTGNFSLSLFPLLETQTYLYHKNTASFWQYIYLTFNDYSRPLNNYLKINLISNFLPKIGFPLIILAVLSLLKRKVSLKWICFNFVLAFIFIYNFKNNPDQWSQYGTRYWYPILGAMAILAALGLSLLRSVLPRFLWFGIVIASLSIQLIELNHNLRDYSKRFKFVEEVNTDMQQRCPQNSIKLLKQPPYPISFPPFLGWQTFHRNFISFEPKFSVYNQKDADLFIKNHPEYTVCTYDFLIDQEHLLKN